MDKYDQIEKIKKLLDDGAMTQEEFEREKDRILNSAAATGSDQFWGMQENEYCMFMHLSQFLGFILPFAGLVFPVVMWALAKDYSRTVDNHGRIIFNWILSCIIYFIISFILVFVFIGIPLMFGIVIVNLVFIVLGAIKARGGEAWAYPLSLPFFARGEAEES